MAVIQTKNGSSGVEAQYLPWSAFGGKRLSEPSLNSPVNSMTQGFLRSVLIQVQCNEPLTERRRSDV